MCILNKKNMLIYFVSIHYPKSPKVHRPFLIRLGLSKTSERAAKGYGKKQTNKTQIVAFILTVFGHEYIFISYTQKDICNRETNYERYL